MGARDGARRNRVEQVFGEFRQVGDIHAAVAAVALPKPFGFEVLSQRRRDYFTGEQFLDELHVRSQRRRRRRTQVRVLAVHPRNSLAKRRELLLDILHSLFLCPI